MSHNDLPRTGVRIAGRMFAPGADRGVAAMLTAVSWVLQRLPGQVVEEQRGELIQTLSRARNLVVEVHCSPPVLVRVRDGRRLLVEIPAEAARKARRARHGLGTPCLPRRRIAGPSCRTACIGRPWGRCSSIRICRTGDLEGLVRHAGAMASCRSFDDVVRAFRAMRALG